MTDTVEICEVGMRDGLQSVASIMATGDKLQWIDRAVAAGMRHIEVGSFVSPKLLPQLADTGELVRHARQHKTLRVAALVPNLKGAISAVDAGVSQLTLPVSMTEEHSMSNLRRSRQQVVDDCAEIVKHCAALPPGQRPRIEASLSMAFGCNQGGRVAESEVLRMSEALLKAGVDLLRPADTIGYGNPAQLRSLISQMREQFGTERVKGVHLHNSRGQGLAMVVAALDIGLRSFDSSLAGLGGCPFAPGASGNIVTEDLVWLLESMGLTTGIDIDALLTLREFIQSALPNENLYGFVGNAGLPLGWQPARTA